MTTIRFKTRPCTMCGQASVVMLDADKYDRWRAGENVQSVWPEMSADNRELLISGTHPACWEQLFAGMEDE